MNLWRRKTARAYVYDQEKKLFLIVKSSLPPFGLHLPGGGIDRGESAEEAVKRELKEELNILLENIVSIVFVGNRKSWTLFIPHSDDLFLVIVKSLQIKLSWEINEIYWKTPEEIRSSGKADIVDRVMEYIDEKDR